MRGVAQAERLASFPHSRDGRFDGGAPLATAAADPCRRHPGERLGAGDCEMVQPLARIRFSDSRHSDARHLRAYGDAEALRFHRAQTGPIGAGALWQGTEGPDGRRAEARRRARTVLSLTFANLFAPSRNVAAALMLAFTMLA